MNNTPKALSPRGIRMAIIAWVVVTAIILADQAIKIWIKTNFYLTEDYEVFSWFHIHFIQNNGMAFGLELVNKYILTSLRIVLFGFLVWYLRELCRRAWAPMGYFLSVALVAAGAFGNIVDCIFYGQIFNNPYPPAVATFVPWGEGYAPLFQGLVVDMFYFPLFSFTWPEWMPVVGGTVFSFFDPVFNLADAAISVGMVAIILFYFNLMETSLKDEKPAKDSTRA